MQLHPSRPPKSSSDSLCETQNAKVGSVQTCLDMHATQQQRKTACLQALTAQRANFAIHQINRTAISVPCRHGLFRPRSLPPIPRPPIGSNRTQEFLIFTLSPQINKQFCAAITDNCLVSRPASPRMACKNCLTQPNLDGLAPAHGSKNTAPRAIPDIFDLASRRKPQTETLQFAAGQPLKGETPYRRPAPPQRTPDWRPATEAEDPHGTTWPHRRRQ